MFCVYILFYLGLIGLSWQDETLDLSKNDIRSLDDDNNVKIPWLALLTLTKRDILFTEPKALLSGKPMGKWWPSVKFDKIRNFPWHAQVYTWTYICGGVVVSNRVIVTAAHCLFDEDDTTFVEPNDVEIFLGSSRLLKGNNYKVCKISVHPGYLKDSYYYDVALLLLQNAIKFNENIQPAKIIKNDHWRNTKYGFDTVGFMDTTLSGRLPVKVLLIYEPWKGKLYKISMRLVGSSKCNMSPNLLLKSEMPIPPHMFCMIGEGKKDCFGDPGSGVVWRGFVVGLVAVPRGEKCGTTNIPSMYNDLNFFRKWIREESNQLESFSSKCKR